MKATILFTVLSSLVIGLAHENAAHAYAGIKDGEDGDLTGRESLAAEYACTKQDLHAGFLPGESAQAEQSNALGAAMNLATSAIGGAQAGQGQNQQNVNNNLASQARRKAAACRKAYKNCTGTASIEKEVYSAEAKVASQIPELSDFSQDRQKISDARKQSGEKCEKFEEQAKLADQQAGSNDAGGVQNAGVVAANSIGAATGGGGGGSTAPSSGGGSTTAAGAPAAAKSTGPQMIGFGLASNAAVTGQNAPVGTEYGTGAVGAPTQNKIVANFRGIQPAALVAGGSVATATATAATTAAAGGGSEMRGSGGAGSVGSFAAAGAQGSVTGASGGGETRGGGGAAGSMMETVAQANARRRAAIRGVSGMSVPAVDGITAPMGPSLFEKVSQQFQRQQNSLYAAPEDNPAPKSLLRHETTDSE